MQFALMAPDPLSQRSFNLHQVDGVQLFMHQGLLQRDREVRVELGGFWRLRWLRVRGLAPLAACAL
ncbi:MAG: hypothetical protein AB1814_15260 [Thermodesulfobacteriota bacterium]